VRVLNVLSNKKAIRIRAAPWFTWTDPRLRQENKTGKIDFMENSRRFLSKIWHPAIYQYRFFSIDYKKIIFAKFIT